jgi:dTDP-4-dehydrorhamnose reductase
MPQAIKKVLVTASNGQVGYLLSQKLEKLKDEFELFSFDRVGLDITSQGDVAGKCYDNQPDIIINCAAHTGVDKAETDIENSFAINELGPKYLAEQALKHDALLIHISTDYVFDGNKAGPYFETDTPNPQGVYGKSKLAGEVAIQNIGCKHVILRTAWVFAEYGNNFVKTMLKLGKAREELGIIGDQFGGPTYAGDIADAAISISKKYQNKKESGVYHFSGYPHVSWYVFAKSIFDHAEQAEINLALKALNEIPATAYPLPAPRPASSRLDCSKLENKYGIKPSNWQAALNRIKEYE